MVLAQLEGASLCGPASESYDRSVMDSLIRYWIAVLVVASSEGINREGESLCGSPMTPAPAIFPNSIREPLTEAEQPRPSLPSMQTLITLLSIPRLEE
jgi:hypothetical protein